MRTLTAVDTLSSQQVVDACPMLTYRQLDHWCRLGLLGPHPVGVGSGRSRRFTAEDLAVVRVMALVSAALTNPDGHIDLANVRRLVGEQARTGATRIELALSDCVRLVVDLPEERHA